MIARRFAPFAVALLLAAPAFAQDPPPPETAPPPVAPAAVAPAAVTPAGGPAFAKKGVIEIEGGIGFSFSKASSEGSEASYSFDLYPAARYFIIDKLSIGARLVLGYTKSGDSSFTSFGIVPLVEYNFDLGSRIFPYVGGGIGYVYNRFSGGGMPASGASSGVITVGGGVKINFGRGGILGVGLEESTGIYDGYQNYGLSIFTRYGVYFSIL